MDLKGCYYSSTKEWIYGSVIDLGQLFRYLNEKYSYELFLSVPIDKSVGKNRSKVSDIRLKLIEMLWKCGLVEELNN